jgi:excisionase family DNA binding protein
MEKNIHENTDIHSKKEYTEGERLDAHLLFNNLIWLTTEEAARFLRKSSHALRQMIYKGKIHPRKFGGRLYFKRSELDQLIDTAFY